MASEWSTAALEELVDDILDRRGVTPLKLGSDFTSAGHRVISAKLMKESRLDLSADEPRFVDSPTYKKWMQSPLLADDVILTSEAPLGEIAYIKEKLDWCLGQRLFGIRTNKSKLFGRFLFYALKSEPVFNDLTSRATGTTVQGIRQSELRRVQIPVPPLAKQKAIAAVLGALDDKIELNRRMNETLEAMARTLFKSWFVDFDPVRAKLDGRKPEGLDEATAALFPDSFQDSELGHIPIGWKATTLGECIGFRSGFSFKSQDWKESGVPVVKIGSVKPGIIDLTQVSYVSNEVAEQASRYRLMTGDMLIGMTGYVGEVGLVPPSDIQPLLNQRVGKFVMQRPGTESLAYWYCTIRKPEFRAFVEARSHGTAQANVSGEAIMEFPLVAPTPMILGAFNQVCQLLLDRILSNHGQSRTLANLRNTLLPKLLNGELSVDKIKEGLVA